MVVDASVIVSRLVPHDTNHEASRHWLTDTSPPEGWSSFRPRLARRAVDAVLRLPELRLVSVDDMLARTAAGLAGRLRLRGADAIYIAVAAGLRLPLVTWDSEQRDRAGRLVEVLTPATS